MNTVYNRPDKIMEEELNYATVTFNNNGTFINGKSSSHFFWITACIVCCTLASAVLNSELSNLPFHCGGSTFAPVTTLM